MKKVLYFIFIFSVLLMSWDFQQQDVAIASNAQYNVEADADPIPDEAIRLRIIANSDSAEDQLLKQKVRDEVIAKINPWVSSLDDLEKARTIINEHLPELKDVVDQTIQKNGFKYSSTVELGIVPFPTKMYGQIVYPAGDYEALRITIGKAEGQNWWCVLFPPLCFVDMSTGQAVSAKQQTEQTTLESTNDNLNQQSENGAKTEEVQVKFFVVEVFVKMVSYVKTLI